MMARHGTSVRIIDTNDAPTTLSKALVVWRRTLQVLDGVVPWESVLHGHVLAERGLFYDGGRQIADLSFNTPGHGIPAGVFIPQCDTEGLLLAALAKRGVQVERSTSLQSFKPDAEGVQCTLDTGETLRTPWLIGCDGAHSTVRHTLGLEFPGETVDQRWLLADVLIDGDAPSGAAIMEGGAQGPVAIFPVGDDRWRIIAAAGPHEHGKTYDDPTVDDIQRVLSERSSLGWTVREALWLGQFGVNERQIDRYVHGRVLLAGDAAHVHSPAGGQGMNTGMQDAANLAWKVSLVECGGAGPGLVETYQAERHPIGAAVVKYTGRMLKAAMLKSPVLRAVRGMGMHLALSVPAVQRKLASAMAEEHVHYRGGPLAATGRGTHRPGDAFPDAELDGQLATNLLRGHEAVLVSAAPGEAPLFGSGGFAMSRVGSPKVVELFGGDVLVRPDGVIAAIGDDIGPWLERLAAF
jgi:2-polyprenyl-6-methoxyphenol hydroxylase-like FAD-dependent oxidoreductase